MASVTRNSDENRARAEAQTSADGGGDTGAASEKPAKVVKGETKVDGGTRAVEPARVTAPGARRGFFTIYKSGQGYWTRMGTLIGAAVLGLMLSFTLYQQIPNFFFPDTRALATQNEQIRKEIAGNEREADPAKKLSPAQVAEKSGQIDRNNAEIAARTEAKRRQGQRVGLAVALGFLAIYSVVAVRLMNKPSNVDFLIATDSEMKKVNWTSRKELIGSTKVVILFMFLIAALLFLIDAVFHTIFYWIDVLKVAPPWYPQ